MYGAVDFQDALCSLDPPFGQNSLQESNKYHPKSGKQTTVGHFKEYVAAAEPQLPGKPWWPFFNSEDDFIFSEILLEGRISKALSERLIKLIKRCSDGQGSFTISNYADIESAWDCASSKLTPFEVSKVSVPYKGKEQIWNVPHRSLWDWVTDLVVDNQLARHFHWDAERIFRCHGQSSTRVYDEPWSGEAFWDIQSQIPEGGKPLGLILYADKTKLSSFGTEQGYPVVARCANLPTSIQNGEGYGGGRVVGWLPIVHGSPSEEKKQDFVNYKRVVWHRAIHLVLESVIEVSMTGYWLICGDGVRRWLFPVVLILSADYEEQTAIHTQELLKDANKIQRSSECEELLSAHGIRNVDNVFWQLRHSDPHRALSFDRLHSNNSGLFSAVPRWSGLIHFQEVMKIKFTDGTKFEDISKVIVFVAHDIIDRREREGWFSIVDLYLAFESHMEHTLTAGKCELENFARQMKVSSTNRGEDVKSWNFPKMHALVHSFDDVKAKGASCNYNTKPNEKLHGPLKKLYSMRTNFKNVAEQILKYEHLSFVSSLIHNQINEVNASSDEYDISEVSEATSSIPQGPELHGKLLIDGHITLRSQQQSVTLDSLGNSFHTQLSTWLTDQLAILNISSLSTVNFHPEDHVSVTCAPWITEYQSLKITYESKVDCNQYINLVYCSPKFHNQERHDFVIVQTTTGCIFAQLLLIFSCSISGTTFAICSIQPLDALICAPPTKDRELGLRRVHARNEPEFIFAWSIVRGAPLIQDFDKQGNYFVMDVVDHTGDMFLRCEEILPW
ncbi:hypothetical protein BC827DRAFT_1280060 [Russula dissimulans]|nr:hypothetical protein BC827DRAFT_1280060 [Russula dissimulans]